MNLLKENKLFSFKLGDNNIWDTEYTRKVNENGNEISTTYTFDGGLKVTNIARKISKHGAYEWVNYFENTGSKPTAIISELWDCDITLPFKHEDTFDSTSDLAVPVDDATKIYAPNGSTWTEYEFFCDVDLTVDRYRKFHILPGETKTYSASRGRSSEEQAPFFNISKQNSGYIFAIGWTGQWNAEISRGNDDITFKSKIEDTYFRLYPSEKIRTSSIVILPYEGDFSDAQNKWRRLLKDEFCLIGKPGRPDHTPLFFGAWGGETTDKMMWRIDKIKESGLPIESLWVDAAWYGKETRASENPFQNDWIIARGDWSVSPLIHPNGMVDVAERLKKENLGFLLWFELERANPNSPLVSEHPDCFLSSEHPGANKLLNLGNEKAWKIAYDIFAGYIEKFDLQVLRIDFNDGPLPYWRAEDACDRKGITEIKYITGFYRLCDAILERFPHVIIDNCASGGRRLDVEMFRRSTCLSRTDYMCNINYDIEGVQCHTITYNNWMIYSGTFSYYMWNKYAYRSAYATSMQISYGIDLMNPLAKEILDEYIKVRPYLTEDFYPLSEVTAKTDTWCAWQFNRPSSDDGVLQVFRRRNSDYERARYFLRGLDENKTYLFKEADGEEITVSGAELKNGFVVDILERESSKLYFYKAI